MRFCLVLPVIFNVESLRILTEEERKPYCQFAKNHVLCPDREKTFCERTYSKFLPELNISYAIGMFNTIRSNIARGRDPQGFDRGNINAENMNLLVILI